MTNIGVDTIKLNLADFGVSSDNALTLWHGSTNYETGVSDVAQLWRNSAGVCEGSKATYDGPDFAVTIKPAPHDRSWVNAFVQFSVPKVAVGSNYEPATERMFNAAIRTAERNLLSVGVKTNLREASLSRIDVTRNVHTNEGYSAYSPVLSMLRGKRTRERSFGDTFYWGNTSHQISAYDKRAEMLSKNHSIVGIPNTVRFEHRLLKSAKCQSFLGMKTVSDVGSDFAHIEAKFKSEMSAQLFGRTVSEFSVLSVDQIETELQLFIERGDKSWFDAWWNAQALLVVPDIDAVIEAVANVAENRAIVSRIRKKLRAIEMDALALQPKTAKRRTVGELYTELQLKALS